MNVAPLIIAGALFHHTEKDILFRPHFTGQYWAVQGDSYYKKSDYIRKFGREAFKENKNDYIEDFGEKYYFADYSEVVNTTDLDLVSDLSNLKFLD